VVITCAAVVESLPVESQAVSTGTAVVSLATRFSIVRNFLTVSW